ncbi:MAG: inositol monophosphatase [Cyanobacteria bacterium]|nr:inositol monophosphatase [Cyanobacteriota bacterium]
MRALNSLRVKEFQPVLKPMNEKQVKSNSVNPVAEAFPSIVFFRAHSDGNGDVFQKTASLSGTAVPEGVREATPVKISQLQPEGQDSLDLKLSKAVDAARKAGKIIKDYFNNPLLKISEKAAQDLVTNADQEADEAIRSLLSQAFPDDTFLTEETFDPTVTVGLENAWVVDPLDATRNFAFGIPHFAVSIAFVQKGKPVLGVVYDPIKDEMFTAIHGKGAQLNGRPIQVSSAEGLKQTIISMPYPFPKKFLEVKATNRRMGCTALDMAYVASGRLGASSEKNLKVWDIAAGLPLVEAAGGTVTDLNNQPLTLNQKGRVEYIASNGKLHPTMLQLTQD